MSNISIFYTGSEEVHKMTNHPVHFKDGDAHFPTALIPFCEFGGSMSVMGTQIDQLKVPVCNSFKPKIVEGQLCYSVNPNQYKEFIEKGRGKYQESFRVQTYPVIIQHNLSVNFCN